MMFTLPLLMVSVFLFLTLVLGLYVSKRAITFREYAVGSKQFHTTTLVITVLATTFGGGMLMRHVPKVHSIGIYFIVLFKAYKVFLRTTLFSTIIIASIVVIGLLVFVADPMLPITAVWPYMLTDMSSAYKGCVVISLLGMAMSTADSSLHTASIMASHDMVESIRGIKSVACAHQLRLAKLTTLATGLLAMIVTVYYPDLFQLSQFVFISLFTFYETIIGAPFILALLGFRGSARTALIGMVIGLLTALMLKRWIQAEIGVGLALLPMLANGLAMMAAHYVLPQPIGKGWVGKSHQQKRIEQLIQAFKQYKKRMDLE